MRGFQTRRLLIADRAVEVSSVECLVLGHRLFYQREQDEFGQNIVVELSTWRAGIFVAIWKMRLGIVEQREVGTLFGARLAETPGAPFYPTISRRHPVARTLSSGKKATLSGFQED